MKKVFTLFLVFLVIISSIRMSSPLLGYVLFHQQFVNECRVIQHHTADCEGQCVLKRELAQQGSKSSELPESSVQKHLKVIDLFIESALNLSPQQEVMNCFVSYYRSELLFRKPAINTPPPRLTIA
ncbi:MAG: hypothetical protein HXX13_13020 [Bacteroidetes bacterium]|nr:hypothetical protein [Bacteroidota bacterium]